MRSTPNTADRWGQLLHTLSDEELVQYARMAVDQVRREERWRWPRRAAALAAAGLLAWTGFGLAQFGFDRMRVWPLGLSGLMGYWPYRSMKAQKLWGTHLAAVRGEQARRRHG